MYLDGMEFFSCLDKMEIAGKHLFSKVSREFKFIKLGELINWHFSMDGSPELSNLMKFGM